MCVTHLLPRQYAGGFNPTGFTIIKVDESRATIAGPRIKYR